MKNLLLLAFAMLFTGFAQAKDCCNVISANGKTVTSKYGCVKAPNLLGADGNCGMVIMDTDGDGVADKADQCINEAGTVENNGCPEVKVMDTDGDGVTDDMDKCINLAGSAENDGCPEVKDTDGDGVTDDMDECINVAGTKANKGCPEVKDSDGDGVADDVDECINESGTAANKGCPELSQDEKQILKDALSGVKFKSGSSVILATSYDKLDKVVSLLEKHPDFKLKISGYTDNTGNADMNVRLSDDRAHACEKYIMDKGIGQNRITAKGYGAASPVADNSTAAGRAKNRRVEFELIH